MENKERLKTAAMATASAIKAKIHKGKAHPGSTATVSSEVVEEIIADWGSFPRHTAQNTIKKYGLPQEATPSQLFWFNNGPWKRTRVLRDEIPHNFPQPHTDVLENVINYQVSPEKLGDLAKFDGSVYIDRTRGEAISRCDMEAANFISLNIMNDLVTGKLTVQEARKKHGAITLSYLEGHLEPYAEGLQFYVPEMGAGYEDKSRIGRNILNKIGGKAEETFWSGRKKLSLLPIAGFVLLLGLIKHSYRGES